MDANAFGLHLGHDIFCRGPESDATTDRIDACGLAPAVRDIMLALVLGPMLPSTFAVEVSAVTTRYLHRLHSMRPWSLEGGLPGRYLALYRQSASLL
jgi:hypothetical protein